MSEVTFQLQRLAEEGEVKVQPDGLYAFIGEKGGKVRTRRFSP